MATKGLSFLERMQAGLTRARRRAGIPSDEEQDEVTAAVHRHVYRLLNARYGMSLSVPDYGIQPLSDLVLGTRDAASTVRNAIKRAIEQYEPRLTTVNIREMGERMEKQWLTFAIDGQIVIGRHKFRVRYGTDISKDGEIKVKD